MVSSLKRMAVASTVSAAGALVVMAIVAPATGAAPCPSAASGLAVGADPASPALPLTGASVVGAVLVGLALIGLGAVLVAVARGRVRLPGARPLAAGLAIMVVGTVCGPAQALAATPAPCASQPAGGSALDPSASVPAVVPEAPWAAALPLSAVAVCGFALTRRRRART